MKMKWYQKTAVLFGGGFLLGAQTVNLAGILLIEHDIKRILPHIAIWMLIAVLVIPFVLKSKHWY